MVKISVIVPVYNTAERLVGCLDSLLGQSFRDFEVILVNDGSTDSSGDICRDYASRHPQVFRLLDGPNGGVSVARNRGLDEAHGDWVAFCDSDDEALPEWLETLHANAVRDGADLSLCALQDIGPTETKRVTGFPMGEQETVRLVGREALERRLLVPLASRAHDANGYLMMALFRRDVIEAHHVRFSPGVSMMEDVLFYVDYLQWAESLTADARPLYRYLRFGQSACSAYYRRDSDYRRERNWHLWTRECLRLLGKGEVLTRHAWLGRHLLLRQYLHESQEICCEPGVGMGERLRRLREVSTRACGEERLASSEMSRGERLFWWTLRRAAWLVPVLCWAKRRGDEAARVVGS